MEEVVAQRIHFHPFATFDGTMNYGPASGDLGDKRMLQRLRPIDSADGGAIWGSVVG